MSDKKKLAGMFFEIAQWLELKGDNPFKVRAYESAARALEQLAVDPAEMVAGGTIEDVPGVGRAIAAKIAEFVKTGQIQYYLDLKASIPPVLFDLIRIPGLGPKKAVILQEKLNLTTIGELEYACRENRLLDLPGFGARTQEKILVGIESLRRCQGQYLLYDVLPVANRIIETIRLQTGVFRASVAGSLRRRMETVKDIDIVVSAAPSEPVMNAVASLQGVVNVIAHGPTKTSVTLEDGLNVDVRAVSPKEYVYALHHFTGSKEHNVKLRGLAKEMGYKINEYGVEQEGAGSVDVKDETEFYRVFGLDYIEPELREGGDELAAAVATGTLPLLVHESDVRGAFHVHTTWSDGRATVSQMAAESKKIGWEYLGISDHSRSAAYARGLKEEDVRRQRVEIDAENAADPSFRIFFGIESDILPDGSLDYPDAVLANFDFVIASVHSSFKMGRQAMTERIVKALHNPYTTMLGHPTGRLLLARGGYDLDLSEILRVAGATGTIVEINASPYRLDLDWRWCRQAKESQVLLAVNPDAHSVEELANFTYGIGVARKGWLEASDILNSSGTAEVVERLNEKTQRRN